MKKIIIGIVLIVGIIAIVLFLPGKEIQQMKYKYTADIKGIGCLRLGESFSQVSAALDSSYLKWQEVLDQEYIRRTEMLKYAEPNSIEIPELYNADYRKYLATVVISKELIAENVTLYFWKDTLQRIWFSNNNHSTYDIGKALIWKYGEGEGYQSKTANRNEELHLWGNDLVVAKYESNITYKIDSDGFPKGVEKWFQEVDIRINNTGLDQRIVHYLRIADSLWTADTYRDL